MRNSKTEKLPPGSTDAKGANVIDFYCVLCGCSMQAPGSLAEDVCECPRCFRFVPVPPETAREASEWPRVYPPDIIGIEIKFPCPECGSKLEVDARNAGSAVYCPICTSAIKTPHLAFLIMPPVSAPQKSKMEFAKPAVNLTEQEIEFLNNVKPDARAKPAATSLVGKSRPNAFKR